MPASCEQRILEQIQQQDAFEPRHHRFSWQKKLGIAVAAAVCISVVSVFSAAAAQNRSLLELLFPQTETTSVSEQLIATNGTMEHVTVSGMNGWDVTPVGVVNDARTIYLIFQIDSHGEKIDSQNMIFLDETKVNEADGSRASYPFINGVSGRDETRADKNLVLENAQMMDITPLDDGAYQMIYRMSFQEPYDVDTMDVELSWSEDYDTIMAQNGLIQADQQTWFGTITATLQLGEPLAERGFSWDEPIALDDRFQLSHVDIQALSLRLKGTLTSPDSVGESLGDTIDLVLQDGRTTTVSCTSAGSWLASDGTPEWYVRVAFQTPLDPEKIAAIRVNGIEIPLA